MKRIGFLFCLISLLLVFTACEAKVSVTFPETLVVGETGMIVVSGNKSEITYSSSDESIATVDARGVVRAIANGEAILSVTIGNVQKEGKLVVTAKEVQEVLTLSGLVTYYEGESGEIVAAGDVIEGIWTSSNDAIMTVSDGHVEAISAGTVVITLTTAKESASLTITVLKKTTLTIEGVENMVVGSEQRLLVTTNGDEQAIAWTSSDESILSVKEGIVKAIGIGSATVTASLNEVKATIAIQVSKKADAESEAKEILARMTLPEKVGQLFVVGFSGKALSASTIESINARHFGNFIMMGSNYGTIADVFALTTALQDAVRADTGVPAFIATDQEGGNVERFKKGATHFLGEMSLGATGEARYAHEVAKACGEELRAFGINLNFSPVMDVNNNPNNPIIGIRSFGDDPTRVASFGVEMIKGYMEEKVMSTAKHFPGHGDTSTDTHSGLPRITYDMERLNEVELVPFKAAIAAGIDCIMTTHIIFSTIDDVYPATLSKKVITGLLREELGFEGMVVTDGMNMNAIAKNWGADAAAVLAINAGVDCLTYTESTTASCKAYDAVLAAALDGTISLSRIDEAVTRILMKKIKYGLMTDPYPKSDVLSRDFAHHEDLNRALLKKSITLVQGEVALSKSEHIAIIGDTSYASDVASKLQEKGYDCTALAYANTPPSSYDKLIYFTVNPSASIVATINRAAEEGKVIVVSLAKPYDLARYDHLVAGVATFGKVPSLVYVLADYLAGEFVATGVLPVSLS